MFWKNPKTSAFGLLFFFLLVMTSHIGLKIRQIMVDDCVTHTSSPCVDSIFTPKIVTIAFAILLGRNHRWSGVTDYVFPMLSAAQDPRTSPANEAGSRPWKLKLGNWNLKLGNLNQKLENWNWNVVNSTIDDAVFSLLSTHAWVPVSCWNEKFRNLNPVLIPRCFLRWMRKPAEHPKSKSGVDPTLLPVLDETFDTVLHFRLHYFSECLKPEASIFIQRVLLFWRTFCGKHH